MMNRILSWGGEGRALRQGMQGGCAESTEPWGRREGYEAEVPRSAESQSGSGAGGERGSRSESPACDLTVLFRPCLVDSGKAVEVLKQSDVIMALSLSRPRFYTFPVLTAGGGGSWEPLRGCYKSPGSVG